MTSYLIFIACAEENITHLQAAVLKNNDCYLSIVIPIYNEEKRISPTIEKLLTYLSRQPFTREIILVDDGSDDKGIQLACASLDKAGENYQVVGYGDNRGKGYALKQGILASQGKYVLFTDADLSTPIEDLDNMWLWFNEGFDIVQGSRKMPGAKIEAHQPWLRENMGKIFTMLSNAIVNLKVSDVTCGFKCYRGEVARNIYGLQRVYDWSFDAEIIHIARVNGYRLKEIPVRWHDERGTKVHLLRDSVRSFRGLLKIRKNSREGYYAKTLEAVSKSAEGKKLLGVDE